jgi:hypothetical protein
MKLTASDIAQAVHAVRLAAAEQITQEVFH